MKLAQKRKEETHQCVTISLEKKETQKQRTSSIKNKGDFDKN